MDGRKRILSDNSPGLLASQMLFLLSEGSATRWSGGRVKAREATAKRLGLDAARATQKIGLGVCRTEWRKPRN